MPTKGCGKKSADDVRLPTDISYEQGVKANVLFFDRTPDKQAWTTKLRIYDPRTNLRFTLKENPLSAQIYLLDTNIVLHATRQNSPVSAALERFS